MTFKEFADAAAAVKFYLAKHYPQFLPADTHYIWSMLAAIEERTCIETMDRIAGFKPGERRAHPGDTVDSLIKEFEEIVGRAKPEKKDVL